MQDIDCGDKKTVSYQQISEQQAGQRLDNFLITLLKGVPNALIYKVIRRGEVRVNKKRAKAQTRLQTGDWVRIPPMRLPEQSKPPVLSANAKHLLSESIIEETADWLVINKPSGWAVHGGTQIQLGLIEALRQWRGEAAYLELVHRLDKETSGCLLIAKNRNALLFLQKALAAKEITKKYWVLVDGHWPETLHEINAPLARFDLNEAEHKVKVVSTGKASLTEFKLQESFQQSTLLEAQPITGRMHQIRVHAAYAGHCVLGDEKYDDEKSRMLTQQYRLKRLFLHAARLEFNDPQTLAKVVVKAPLDAVLANLLNQLRRDP